MASASDVPGRYDIVVDGTGFLLLDSLAPNIPFRTHRAIYYATPTFLERQNVSGTYGDNQQAFWLTANQNDWSLGDGQLFWRPADEDKDKARRYYVGSNIDTTIEGQATLNGIVQNLTFGSSDTVNGVCAAGTGLLYAVSSTHLYSVNGSTVTDLGAHSETGMDSLQNLCSDGSYVYIGDGSKIRSFSISGATFADFSSTPAQSMCVVANTLFGVNASTLSYYSTSGTATTAYTWQDAKGGGGSTTFGFGMKVRPFGGQVVILRDGGVGAGAEIWTGDTTGAQQVAQLPRSFTADDIAVSSGIVFVIGTVNKRSLGAKTQVWYYANGNIGLLWESTAYTASIGRVAICDYQKGVLFTNGASDVGQVSPTLVYYDLSVGASSCLGTYTASGNVQLASGVNSALLTGETSSGGYLVTSATTATSGYVCSSLVDFDSSLTKIFRGVTVEYQSALDGDGGSVDIAYQIDSLLGGYNTLQSSATSGTEYTFNSNTTGRAISIKITLNKGTSTLGPVLKRVYVRAAPKLQSFKKREYIVDLQGTPETSPRRLRDGSPNPAIPFDDLTALNTSINALSPVSITDRLGTFTGIIEPDQTEIYEMHAQQQNPQKSGSYVVKIVVREI